METKAKVEVFSSPTCPHCPHAVKVAKETLSMRDDANLILYSTATSTGRKKAQSYMIMSVPTLVITGPGFSDPIGLKGTPSPKALNNAIDVSLGLKEPEDPKGLWQSIKEYFSK